MINIQSAMLVALGFLVAILLVLLLAPAYWHRAVRLTTQRLKQAMPLTEAEIKADKDRLRAEYAIRVHRLEAQVERSAYDTARQQIELNRRDAAISTLEGEIARISTALDEQANARRVLEHTITDRFPRLEHRQEQTSKLLAQREQELTVATETFQRQARALEEAAQLGAQQRDEVMRLSNALASVTTRRREGAPDAKLDIDSALRTELETLRSTLQQQLAATTGNGAAALPAAAGAVGLAADQAAADLPQSLALARGETEAAGKAKADSDAGLANARQTLENQAIEIAGLKAAVAAYEVGNKDERSISLRDNKLTMKVRLGTLQAENEKQSAAIQRLRTELAAANEKLAKQAAHYVAEMRRIGSGQHTSGATRSGSDARRATAGEGQAETQSAEAKTATPLRAIAGGPGEGLGVVAGSAGATHAASRMRGFLKAIGGSGATKDGTDATSAGPPGPQATGAANPAHATKPDPAGARDGADKPPVRNRLIERIAAVTKT